MKKIKLSTAKLQLKKEQVTALNNETMGMINGGDLSIVDPGNGAFTSIFACSKKRVCVSTNPDPSPESRTPGNCWSYDLVNTCSE